MTEQQHSQHEIRRTFVVIGIIFAQTAPQDCQDGSLSAASMAKMKKSLKCLRCLVHNSLLKPDAFGVCVAWPAWHLRPNSQMRALLALVGQKRQPIVSLVLSLCCLPDRLSESDMACTASVKFKGPVLTSVSRGMCLSTAKTAAWQEGRSRQSVSTAYCKPCQDRPTASALLQISSGCGWLGLQHPKHYPAELLA